MEITIINGSPKLGHSTTELLIEYLLPQISDNNKIRIYSISKEDLTENQLSKIQNSDVLILAFPLYIDSIPSLLLKLFTKLEKRSFASKNTIVYCIINNGFFEGKQNYIAAMQIKNWCKRSNITYGQTVGIGAGEMLPFIKDIPMGHGPNKTIGRALCNLSANIISRSTGKNIFVSPAWPRLLWKIQSSASFWYPRAKANGLKRKELLSRIL